ncbi:hypothetical protein OV079_25495 [Nannocystis pusilla]|uniref:Uncharacterized protein n=1 Tax=Nannocystis pusilla TaxID=889268 RepID=A0A9X3ET83_9BACT|nr:hypothetical protein [Nannocystis pusilla]MCY1008850.1 hypothetical protein [Nannocystis pusilla]
MTRRWLDVVFSSRRELRPARALLSPTWLVALGVLAVNDHLLKGAGLLPGVLTGKLSDFAGMLVAPALLAALLGVTSRRGLLHCHIAVGLVFALINLSPACADAWSWLMGLVGFPWTITVDPTDLLALPALALGWRVLVPAMRPAAAPVSSVSLSRWPTRPEFGVAALGSLLCVATSDTDDGGEGTWGDEGGLLYQDFEADVYLHNSHAEQDIVVRVRDLLPDVEIDCFNVQSKPGVLFSEALFGEGQTWSIPPAPTSPPAATSTPSPASVTRSSSPATASRPPCCSGTPATSRSSGSPASTKARASTSPAQSSSSPTTTAGPRSPTRSERSSSRSATPARTPTSPAPTPRAWPGAPLRAASTGSPSSSWAATAAPPSTSTTACCRASTSAPR